MLGNIGNIFTIALRALNHRNEIEKVLSRIPSTQQQINELTRFANDIVTLVDKIAPGTFGQAQSQQTTTQQTLDVRWLQTSLNRLDNAGLAVDGDYGPLTKQAVTNFQRKHGLTADGWAGVQTQAKIFELLG